MADGVGHASPAPTCLDGYESITPGWVVDGPGPLGGFELRLDDETYGLGDQFVAELRNVTDETQLSGARTKYDIQFQASDGWQTIIGAPAEGRYPWTAEGVMHQPGEGYTWQLTLSQDGVSGGREPAASYRACQPIVPGNYRFVYWGITPAAEPEAGSETDAALGIPFAVATD